MKTYQKQIIHDKPITILMILTLSLSLWFVLIGLQFENEIRAADTQRQKEAYQTQIGFTYQNMEDAEDEQEVQRMAVEKLYIQKGNVIFKEVYFFVGDARKEGYVDIILKWNEPLAEELQTGDYPKRTEVSRGKRMAIIGCGLQPYVQKKGKKSLIKIDGAEYEVTGILEDITKSGADERIILFYSCLAERTKNNITRWMQMDLAGFTILYGSNQNDLEEEILHLQNWLYGIADQRAFTITADWMPDWEVNESQVIAFLFSKLNVYIMYILFAFSMCNCSIISAIWIKRRRKEFVIRKALGAGSVAILCLLVKNICAMLMASLCLDFLIYGVYRMFVKGSLLWQISDMVAIGISLIVLLVITMIQPMIQVFKINPAQGVRTL